MREEGKKKAAGRKKETIKPSERSRKRNQNSEHRNRDFKDSFQLLQNFAQEMMGLQVIC